MTQPELDLNTVYTTLSHAETIEVLNELVECRDEYEDSLLVLKAIEDEFEVQNRINETTEQLKILNKNIKTVQVALLAHEAKIFEKSKNRGKMAVICLN